MKKITTLIFSLFASLILFSQPGSFTSEIQKIAQADQLRHQNIKNYTGTKTGDSYDVVYHRFNWEINPAVWQIKGQVTTYFKPLSTNFNLVDFDLRSPMVVDSVKYHDSSLQFTHQLNIVSITLPSVVGTGVLDSISVFYHGTPSQSGFGSFSQVFHSGTPVISTLSEPYGSSDWWPCKDGLTDKIDSIDVFVLVPSGNKAASNGVLLSETIQGNNVLNHWKHKHPIVPYLIAVAVTNYVAYSEFANSSKGEPVEILNYVYPEHLSIIQEVTPLLIPSFEYFDQVFIPYPYSDEKYGHAQFNWGGGMEHQTMTFLGVYNFDILTHELAHQWFGDYITCGSWQDIWLNEGFATYCEMLAKEEIYPEDTLAWKEEVLMVVTSEPDGSVYCYDTTSESNIFSYRLSYLKGAAVLNMLRRQIGDQAFFQGVRNYLNDPMLANGFARTPDLKAHFEATADTNLTEFFNDWVYGEGYPSYSITYKQDASNTLTLNILQYQSHESVECFEMKVPLLIKGNYYVNDSTLRDTSIVFTFHNTSNNQAFIIENVNFNVNSLAIDPYKDILTANDTIVSINETAKNEGIQVFPNPAVQTIHFKSFENLQVESVCIFDATGMKMLESSGNNKSVFVGNLNPGMYFAQIKTRNSTRTLKFLKQ